MGWMGLGRSDGAIELKIIFAHQLHPFRRRYERAAMGISETKAGAGKRYKREKHCNGDGCIVDHDGLLAGVRIFEPDSVALAIGKSSES